MYLKILLSVLVVFLPTQRICAQFYDSDNEIRIYVLDYVIENPGEPVVAFVMNFNGQKGAIVAKSIKEAIKNNSYYVGAPGKTKNDIIGILEDDSYFEKHIYDSPDIINYNSANSTLSKVCYSATRYVKNLYNPFKQDSYTEFYYFSSNGNRVVEISGSNFGDRYKNLSFTRVSKDKLVELILANKNKGSERWR